MAKEIDVNFNILRYANCWEDAEILLHALSPKTGSKILSIGSAGDNTFSLLTTDPELVIAVDISPTQLYLIELKCACFQHLKYSQTLEFLGFKPSIERSKTYSQIRSGLTSEAANYWDNHLETINEGVIFEGKFEKYLLLFCRKVLPYIHSRKNTSRLFQQKSEQEQKAFYDKHWNTWRWWLLFKIFFSRFVMGRFGRDPKFMKEVKLNVSDFIYKQAEKCLSSVEVSQNHYLRFMLQGSFNEALPHYIREENYDKIRANLSKLKLVKGYVQDAKEFGPFQYFNLSNIFEYMDAEMFRSVSEQVINMADKKAKLAYWNLMVPRKISKIYPEQIRSLEHISELLHEQDKCFFYSNFLVEEVL
ncbi:MAG: DUF3419 family protein [Bacteroidia bacterium]